MQTFAIARNDGRSNAQVVVDLVSKGSPGDVFSYDQIANELNKGTRTTYDKPRVQSIVVKSLTRLLKEYKRTLQCVRGQGYRIAEADRHMVIANDRRRRADVQMKKGLDTLQHVRWDEMDEQTRLAHEGTLMITQAIYANQVALERRQQKVEEALKKQGIL